MEYFDSISPAAGRYGVLAELVSPLHKRDSRSSTDRAYNYSSAVTTQILTATAVVSAVSLVLSSIVFYLFRRMRRNFNHQLILMLITSNAFKSLLYFIYPVALWSGTGRRFNSHGFCQAQGFFMTVAVEASDFAIFAIALHSAVFVLGSSRQVGIGGLYPYRRIVYTLWILWPIAAASLAFIGPGDGYVEYPATCYLPKYPIWRPLVISWIPRYIVFFTIIFSTLGIYIHVHRKFRGFGQFGLARLSVDLTDLNDRTLNSLQSPGRIAPRSAPEMITWQTDSTYWYHTGHGIEIEEPANPFPWQDIAWAKEKSPVSTKISALDFARNLPTRIGTTISQRKPSTTSARSSPSIDEMEISPHSSVIILDSRTQPEDLMTTRLAIQRQLRTLFIYPVVYILLWIVPYIHYQLSYHAALKGDPSSWLALLTAACLTFQAGADAIVFAIKERPWRRSRTKSSAGTV